uniref:Uncharacterized protein n=1 Tax=Monopterus albus TaxID=43700 RepID=A0A3Q3ILB2_MONAL
MPILNSKMSIRPHAHVLQLEVLIVKLLSVDGLASSSIVVGEIPPLKTTVQMTVFRMAENATRHRLQDAGQVPTKVRPTEGKVSFQIFHSVEGCRRHDGPQRSPNFMFKTSIVQVALAFWVKP